MFESLTDLDLRDGAALAELDLSNLPSVQVSFLLDINLSSFIVNNVCTGKKMNTFRCYTAKD